MLYGKVFSAAFGPTAAMVLYVKGTFFGGGLLARIYVRPEYAERYFAVFINGVFVGTFQCNEQGFVEVVAPGISSGSSINSIQIEDVGALADIPADTLPYIAAQMRAKEALSASCLNIVWNNTNKYKLTGVNGDTQLSSITITGAQRGVNCTVDQFRKQRARLYYTITAIGGSRIVRWYDGTRLVSEGTRTGNGAVACTEIDGSGLSVACTLTYTGAVIRGDAFLDIKWPATYKIYYSTSAINYSVDPQATYADHGGVPFNYITGTLAVGSYYYNVVSVDDEDDVETGMADLGPLVIKAVPTKPVISGVTTVSANVLRVAFTADAAATNTLYFSEVNQPINFGSFGAGPTPVAATTPTEDITIPAFTTQNDETAYNTLESAFDSAVSTANALFAYATFTAAFSTMKATVEAAVNTFSVSTRLPFRAKKEALAVAGAQCAANLATLVDSTAFDAYAPAYYGLYLQQIGGLLEDNPARYSLPDGTTAGDDTVSQNDNSLWDLVQPFVKRNLVHIVLRSTIATVEDQNDVAWEVELDAAGSVVAARPAKASIVSYEIDQSGATRTVTVVARVNDDNSEASSTLDLHVVTGAIVPTAPTQNIALPTAVAGFKQVTFAAVTVSANTWYNVAVLAKTAASIRSEVYDTIKIYVGNDTPSTAGNIAAYVVRSKGS